LLFPLYLLSFSIAQAQVAPACSGNPPGASTCAATCIYCNFDGYMGNNYIAPSGGADICGSIAVHNDRWFGFIAGSSTISLDIISSNCVNGDGLQAAFFDNCSDVASLVCDPGNDNAAAIPLTLFYDNFVPGETYFLMIDGWAADSCDFTIDVTSGSVSAPPPGVATQPQGPNVVCPGAVVVYTIPDVPGAGYYNWTAPPGAQINGGGSNVNIDGSAGTTVTITFGTSGGNVCVRAANACSPPTALQCLPVTNTAITPTQLPDRVVCYNPATPFVWDQTPNTVIPGSGTFNLTSSPYDSYLGCDSVVKQKVIVKQIPASSITPPPYVCPGSCITVNGTQYCNQGTFSEVFQSVDGCDSLVNFTLNVVNANANIPAVGTINCSSPSLTLNSTGSTPISGNASYSWRNGTWGTLGSGATQNVTQTGTYYLIVTGTGGGLTCRDTAVVMVNSNVPPPGANAVGGSISCASSTVMLQGSSSTSGVNYLWAGPGITPANQNQQNPTVNQAGTYTLTVTNPANSCASTATANVVGNNTPPAAAAIGDTITCSQTSVSIDGSTNIASPIWNWSGPGITPANQNVENPTVTVPGSYSVTVTNNSNGCSNTASTTVNQNNNLPSAAAGTDITLTCAQPNAILQGSGSAGSAMIQYLWSGPGITPANQNQPNPSINQQGTYILAVTNTENSCVRRDTVMVASNQVLPTANAGADSTITCAETSVTLVGSGSSSGAGFSATWSGPGINAGNQNLYAPVVNQAGNYTLTILNTASGCSATDNVSVTVNTTLPTANAGTDQMLTCNNPNGVTLLGSGSPATITYLWSGTGIGANNATQSTPLVTQPDTYTLQVTNTVNGCTATDQVLVTQDANVPVANGGQDLTLNCAVNSVSINGSGSSAGAGITYQWAGPGISGANASAQSPANLTMPGTYNLTVTNTNNNCFNTDIVVIQIDTIRPTANAGSALVLNCFNNAIDTLDASASSTGSIFSLIWNGPGITPANQNSAHPVINNQPGTYTLTVTNTTNTCTASAQVAVTADVTPPTADAGLDKIIDCVTTSTSVGGNSSVGANFQYLWTGPDITPQNATLAAPTVALAGTYNLTVTNTQNGCTASNDAIVTTNAVYPVAAAGLDTTLTCALPNTDLDGSASSSGVDILLAWSGPSITPVIQNQVSPNISLPGTYILTITNTTNSCVDRDTVLVAENKAIPAASAGADAALDCQTTSTILNGAQSATGATIAYQWVGAGITPANASQQSPSVTEPSLYTLTVTNMANGCSSTDQVQVTEDVAPPTANAGADIELTCAQSTLAINGSGSSSGADFEYVWQGPGINTSNFSVISPMVSDSGTYIVTVTNIQNNCTATDVVFVGMDKTPPLTAAGADQTITCAADTVQLDASLSQSGAGITLAWQGPGIVAGQESSATPNVFEAGLYTLTVTDGNNGCTNTDAVNVAQNTTSPLAVAGSDLVITCANSAAGVTLSSTGSNVGTGYTLLWSGPGITPANQNAPNPTVLVPGDYQLQVTDDANGCTATDAALVNQDQNLPTANAGLDQTITCAQNNATLDGTGSSAPGGGSLQFTWSGPGINAGNANSAQPNVTLSGTYTLTVVNSVTSCEATDQVIVALDNQPPTISVTSDTITCQNQQGTLSVSSSATGSTYFWEGPDIDQTNVGSATFEVDQPGAYSVTVTAPNGCTASQNATMSVDADFPLGIAEGNSLNCNNNSVAVVSAQVSTPGATFFWSGPGIGTVDSLSATVTQPGIYVFTIVSPNGCERPIEVEVLDNTTPPAVAALVDGQLNCNTTSLTINGVGTDVGPNFSYDWTTSDGEIVSGANTLNPVVNSAGSYQLLVTNTNNGCQDSTTVAVTNDPEVPTAFDLSVRDILCAGETNGAISINGVVGGTQPFFFQLEDAGGTSDNQYTGLAAGNYTLTLEDANGCLLDTVVAVSEPAALTVELGPDVEVALGDEASVEAQIANTTPIASVVWNFAPNCDSTAADCLRFEYMPLESYRHTITIVDSNGCTARDEVRVVVRKDRLVFVPNIFSPNSSDAFNSQLMIQGGRGVAKVHTWLIYDRWGNAVFQVNDFLPNDPAFAWSGKVRGDNGQLGVYAWYAKIEFIDGATEEFKGDVTLMR
jgi:hypothetical protein